MRSFCCYTGYRNKSREVQKNSMESMDLYPEIETPIGTLMVMSIARDRVLVGRTSDRPLRKGAEPYDAWLLRRADRWEMERETAAQLPPETVQVISDSVALWAAENEYLVDKGAIDEATRRVDWIRAHYLQEALAEHAEKLQKAAEEGAFKLPHGDVTQDVAAEVSKLRSLSEQIWSVERRILALIGGPEASRPGREETDIAR
jgi:hypothetical protein